MKIPFLLIASLLASIASIAHGKQCNGIEFPERVQVDATDLSLNGLGIRKATFLKVNVYVGALYVAQPSQDAGELLASLGPYELVLHFVRDVGAADLRNAWNEGFAKNAKEQLPALQDRIARLNGWMDDIKKGQRLTFIREPGMGIEVDVNGVTKGAIEGEDFARAFLAIWLGPSPPNPELKSGLLGGACK
jgi:hypothetical protein